MKKAFVITIDELVPQSVCVLDEEYGESWEVIQLPRTFHSTEKLVFKQSDVDWMIRYLNFILVQYLADNNNELSDIIIDICQFEKMSGFLLISRLAEAIGANRESSVNYTTDWNIKRVRIIDNNPDIKLLTISSI